MRMTQQQFAGELGVSLASIQNYERGSAPSVTAINKMKTLAARKGLADLAIELDHGTYEALFEPRDGILSRPKIQLPAHGGKDLRDTLHQRLDELLAAGDHDAVIAIDAVLQALTNGRRVKKQGGRS